MMTEGAPVNKNVGVGTTVERYRYLAACSLIAYAGNSPGFARELQLKVRIASAFRKAGENPPIPRAAAYIYPLDRVQAERRVEWLMDVMGKEQGMELLLAWASDPATVSPKSLVVGIVGLAIPGITLGEIKRKRRLLNVFVNKRLSQDLGRLAITVNRSSHALVRQALRQTEGDIKKMEPDMADWLYEEGETQIFLAEEPELERIQGLLKRLGIPHHSSGSSRIEALSVSPALNQFMLSDWKITKLG